MIKKGSFRTVLIALIAIGSITHVYSQTLDGKLIIEKMINRDQGGDQSAELTMLLVDKSGRQHVRQLAEYKKRTNGSEKSLMIFRAPADVKNCAFLSYSNNSTKISEQWLYLPSIGKVRPIKSIDINKYFMGTDYTYNDLFICKLDDDTHKLLREENINNKACYVVESVSKNKNYLYSKTITWIDKSTFIIVKKEIYDKRGKLLKILTINETKEFNGYLIITKSEMKNVQTNHRTIILVNKIDINKGISDNIFTVQRLDKGL